MTDLRSRVSEGDNIHAAKKKIEGRYHSLSEVHDPTGLGKKLWMHVSFGLQASALETFAYITDRALPFGSGKGLGALIEADAGGTIQRIR